VSIEEPPRLRREHPATDRASVAVVGRGDNIEPPHGDFATWAQPYKVCNPQTAVPRNVEFHEARQTLAAMLAEVAMVEGPIHLDLAAKRLADRWGLQRIGGRMLDAVNQVSRVLVAKGYCERRGEFLWPKRDEFKLQVRRPLPDQPDTFRQVEHIPHEEIELAMSRIVRPALSLAEEELVTQVARVFGFDRTGSRIRAAVTEALERAVRSGSLIRRGDRLSSGSAEGNGL
jgi:hypothetical protein